MCVEDAHIMCVRLSPTPGILSNRVLSDRSKSQGHVPSPLLPFGRFRIDFGSFSVCFQHAVGWCERIFALLPASPPVSITPGVHGEMFEKSFLNLLLSSPRPANPWNSFESRFVRTFEITRPCTLPPVAFRSFANRFWIVFGLFSRRCRAV